MNIRLLNFNTINQKDNVKKSSLWKTGKLEVFHSSKVKIFTNTLLVVDDEFSFERISFRLTGDCS